MSIITGKNFAVFAAAALVTFAAQAETNVLFETNFEDAVPGQTPAKWQKIWGGQGSDTFTVTSEKSATGDHSLMLDRTDNAGQWGFGVIFGHPPKGVLKVEYCVLFDGPGNQAALGFELRENISGRIVTASFTVQDFAIRDGKRKKVFELTRDTWYQVTFTVPLTEADGKVKKITVKELKGDKEVVVESEMTAYPAKLGQFLINTQPGKNNYRAFFDDVKVTVETE